MNVLKRVLTEASEIMSPEVWGAVLITLLSIGVLLVSAAHTIVALTIVALILTFVCFGCIAYCTYEVDIRPKDD